MEKPQYPQEETEVAVTDPLRQAVAEQRLLVTALSQTFTGLRQQASETGTAIDETLEQMDRLSHHYIEPLT